MKVKISQTIEKEIDIEFPAYYDYAGVNKVLSPDSYIQARSRGGEFSIYKHKDMPGCVENIIQLGTPITKEEFMKGYNKAMNYIVHEAFMQEFEGATKTELRKAIYESNMDVCEHINESLEFEL